MEREGEREGKLIGWKRGRSSLFVGRGTAPFSLFILWGMRLLAVWRWLMVPVNMAITMHVLPAFMPIIHCQLGPMWAPDFMQFSSALNVKYEKYENVFGIKSENLERQQTLLSLWCVKSPPTLSHSLFSSQHWMRYCFGGCRRAFTIGCSNSAARWNTSSCKIHMSMD